MAARGEGIAVRPTVQPWRRWTSARAEGAWSGGWSARRGCDTSDRIGDVDPTTALFPPTELKISGMVTAPVVPAARSLPRSGPLPGGGSFSANGTPGLIEYTAPDGGGGGRVAIHYIASNGFNPSTVTANAGDAAATAGTVVISGTPQYLWLKPGGEAVHDTVWLEWGGVFSKYADGHGRRHCQIKHAGIHDRQPPPLHLRHGLGTARPSRTGSTNSD